MKDFATHHVAPAGDTGNAATIAPGRRTLTMGLPATGSSVQAAPAATADRATTDAQLRSMMDAAIRPDLFVHQAAAHGLGGGGGGPLPHLDRIQQAFGKHDVRHVRAQIGGRAAEAAGAMGAEAYAVGDQVAFAGTPSLYTAAHEAAHVVQQRAGVHLKGGVGEAGDVYERHADEVADLVVAGKSAEAALSRLAGGGGATTAVQHRLTKVGDFGYPIDLSGSKSMTTYTGNQAAPRVATGSTGSIANNPGNTMQTRVTYSPTTAEGDGTEMIADPLGPDHKLGTEPESGGIWHDRTKELAAVFGDEHVAGHLLNHQLGGPGNDARNLTPIPGSANGMHKSHVESHIKRLVNHEHAWVYYRVRVHHSPHTHVNEKKRKPGPDDTVTINYPSSLECWWHQYDINGARIAGTEGHCQLPIPHNTKKQVKNLKVGEAQAYNKSRTTPVFPAIAGGTPNVGHNNGDLVVRDGAAAYTDLEYDDVILDLEKDVAANALALHALAAALRQTDIIPSFVGSPAAVAKDVATVLNQKLSTEEEDAVAALVKEAQAFQGDPDNHVLDDKVIQDSLGKARAERTKRIDDMKRKAEALYRAKYADGRATAFAAEFGTGLDQQLTLVPEMENFVKVLVTKVRDLQTRNQELTEQNEKLEKKSKKRKIKLGNKHRVKRLRRESTPGQLSEMLKAIGQPHGGSFDDNFNALEDHVEKLEEKDDGDVELQQVFTAIDTTPPTHWGANVASTIVAHKLEIAALDARPYAAIHPPLAQAMSAFVGGQIDQSMFEALVREAHRTNAQATSLFLGKLQGELS